MIRDNGCPLLRRQQCAPATCDLASHDPRYRVSMVVTTAMDTRWFRSCRWHRVGLVGWAAVGAPFPARATRCSPALQAICVFIPVPLTSSPASVAGLGSLPTSRVARAAVPDEGARPFTDEPVAVGCHATGGGADPRSPARPDKSRCDPQAPGPCGPVSSGNGTGTHRAAHVTLGSGLRVPEMAEVGTGPQPVAWHPAAAVSSRAGVPPRRGRPPAQRPGAAGNMIDPSRARAPTP
jgi:hypothetical protein